MNQHAFLKHFDAMIERLDDRMAHEQMWIEERNRETLEGRYAVAAAEIAVAWRAIAEALDRGRSLNDLLTNLRDALWHREELARVPKRKTGAQLDRDIADVLKKR